MCAVRSVLSLPSLLPVVRVPLLLRVLELLPRIAVGAAWTPIATANAVLRGGTLAPIKGA
jgi:hypothetical protein